MGSESDEMKARRGFRSVIAIGIAGVLVGAMALGPIGAAATNSPDEGRVIDEQVIERGEVENLQRWVSAGHADWCKDPRLVAAEELKRLAVEYSGNAFELSAVADDDNSNDGDRMTFEWATVDGRVLYRVTVERFEWLLPIAKNMESMVWVPSSTEIRSQE